MAVKDRAYYSELGFEKMTGDNVAVESTDEITYTYPDTWVGNIQWDFKGAKMNLRLTGNSETDDANLDNMWFIYGQVVGKDFINKPPERPAAPAGGGGQPAQYSQPRQAQGGGSRRSGGCQWYATLEGPICEETNTPFRYFQAGNAKATGRPYPAFYKCQTQGHDTSVNEAEFAAAQ